MIVSSLLSLALVGLAITILVAACRAVEDDLNHLIEAALPLPHNQGPNNADQ